MKDSDISKQTKKARKKIKQGARSEKRIRQAARNATENKRYKTIIKNNKNSLVAKLFKGTDEILKDFSSLQSAVDRASKKNVINPNKASRIKSLWHKKVKKSLGSEDA